MPATTFELEIYLNAGWPRDYGDNVDNVVLGRSWFVAIKALQDGNALEKCEQWAQEDIDIARALCCPWTWEDITWRQSSPRRPDHRVGEAMQDHLTGQFDTYCKERLNAHLNLSAFLGVGSYNDGEIDEVESGDSPFDPNQSWPTILASYSRLAPQITHGLNLAFAHEVKRTDYAAAMQSPIEWLPQRMTLGGADLDFTALEQDANNSSRFSTTLQDVTVNGQLVPELVVSFFIAAFTPTITPGAQLIDFDTCLVKVVGETSGNWLGEIKPRLAQALSPMLRIPEYLRLTNISEITRDQLADVIDTIFNFVQVPSGGAIDNAHAKIFDDVLIAAKSASDNPWLDSLTENQIGAVAKNFAFSSRISEEILRGWPQTDSSDRRFTPDAIEALFSDALGLFYAAKPGKGNGTEESDNATDEPEPEVKSSYNRVVAGRLARAFAKSALPNERKYQALVQAVNVYFQRYTGAIAQELVSAAVSETSLYSKLMADAADDTQARDYDAIKENFKTRFKEAITPYLVPAIRPATTETVSLDDSVLETMADIQARQVFDVKDVERARDTPATQGLTQRVDLVTLDQEAENKEDVHSVFDGYLGCVRRDPADVTAANKSFRNPFLGRVELFGRPAVAEREDGAGNLISSTSEFIITSPVPFQPAEGAEKTSVRQAIVAYHGRPMLPTTTLPGEGSIPADPIWSSAVPAATGVTHTQQAAAPLEVFDIGNSYDRLPQLAYGRKLEVIYGYQLPGGLLPARFCADHDPFHFDAATLDAIDPAGTNVHVKKHHVLRTLAPSAPRLLRYVANSTEKDQTLAPQFERPGEKEVRPVWREWNEPEAQARRARRTQTSKRTIQDMLKDAPTVFLAPQEIDTPDLRRSEFEFRLRAPALPISDRPNSDGENSVWRYWVRRDTDTTPRPSNASQLLAARPDTVGLDDPAVVGRRRTTTGAGGAAQVVLEDAQGGIYVDVYSIGIDGIPQRKITEFLAASNLTGAGCKVAVVRAAASADQSDPDYRLATVGPDAVLTITLPETFAAYALQFTTAVDAEFLDGADKRFDESVITQSERIWGKSESKSDGRYRFGAAVIVCENVPAINEILPKQDELWAAIALQQDRAGVSCSLFQPSVYTDHSADVQSRFDALGEIETWHQTWRWDGGPVTTDDFGPDELQEEMVQADKEPATIFANKARSEIQDAFETAYFHNQPGGGEWSVAQYSSTAKAQTSPSRARTGLFDYGRDAQAGADYLRVRLRARSRYGDMLAAMGLAESLFTRDARAAMGATPARNDRWKGLALPSYRTDPLPRTIPSLALPTFRVVDNSIAAPAALLLDHTLYDTRTRGGLGERMDVEITIRQIQKRVALNGDDTQGPGKITPGATRGLEIGADPLWSTSGDPFRTGSQADARFASRPEDLQTSFSAIGAELIFDPNNAQGSDTRLTVALALGQTLEPASDLAQFPFVAALLEPTFSFAGRQARALNADVMARIRVRSRMAQRWLAKEAVEIQAPTGSQLASEWSEPLWVTFHSGFAQDRVKKRWTTQDPAITVSDSVLPRLSQEKTNLIPRLERSYIAVPLKALKDVHGKTTYVPLLLDPNEDQNHATLPLALHPLPLKEVTSGWELHNIPDGTEALRIFTIETVVDNIERSAQEFPALFDTPADSPQRIVSPGPLIERKLDSA